MDTSTLLGWGLEHSVWDYYMVIPYFIADFWLMLSACAVLIISPFVTKG